MSDETLNSVMGWREYFVDEAGDPILFNKQKQVVIGREGCSRFFILGLIDVRDRIELELDLNDLRQKIINDPYFRDIPSLSPSSRKTRLFFHAKDDIPEIRERVFRVLMSHDIRFYATIREKDLVLVNVLDRNRSDPAYRYKPNDLYDLLTRRLFSGRLHQNETYKVTFAERGASDRTAALRNAMEAARKDFEDHSGLVGRGKIEIASTSSEKSIPLQAVDYFLWALQRMYEKGENRYWQYVWPKVHCVVDLDNTLHNRCGEIYTQENPLTGSLRKK